MILLDTHILIWQTLQPENLSPAAAQAVKRALNTEDILIADITLWEIAMLMSKERLQLPIPYTEFISLIRKALPLQIECISPEIADLSVSLGQDLNLDPADRLIAATSIIRGTPLITADRKLRQNPLIRTIW